MRDGKQDLEASYGSLLSFLSLVFHYHALAIENRDEEIYIVIPALDRSRRKVQKRRQIGSPFL
jgi:hypothetical protein